MNKCIIYINYININSYFKTVLIKYLYDNNINLNILHYYKYIHNI